jgi:tRNA 2-thiouridine synthesizing protein A
MADKILITLGMKCPQPLFQVHRNIKDLQEGQVLEVQADDPAFKLDIEAWCRRTGNQLLDLQQQNGVYVAIIKKAV